MAAVENSILEERLNSLKILVDERHAAQERALIKAEAAADKRFESLNEFRKILADQQGSFVHKGEYDIRHRALNDKVDININRLTATEHAIIGLKELAAARKDIWGILTGIASLLISLGTLILLILSRL